MTVYIGFDLGGTNIKIGLFDKDKQLIRKWSTPTASTKESILVSIYQVIEANMEHLKGIGFSVPGFVNNLTGEQYTAGAIKDLVGFNLKEHITNRYGVETVVENDVNCVTLAEQIFGNGKNVSNFLALTIGTGVGGGIVINNQLYRGTNFAAGEFGFMIVNGIRNNIAEECTLSRVGAILPLREKYARIKGVCVSEVSGEQIFSDEDPRIEYIVNEFKETLVIGLYNLFHLFNPEKILIGGGISSNVNFIDDLKTGLHSLPCDKNISFKIEPCFYKNDAGIVGAISTLGE